MNWDFSGGPVGKTLRSQCRGARVQSHVGELDTACMPQLRVCMPQLRVRMLQLRVCMLQQRSRMPQLRPGTAKTNKQTNK